MQGSSTLWRATSKALQHPFSANNNAKKIIVVTDWLVATIFNKLVNQETADLLSLSKKTEPLLSQRASLTGDRQKGDENVSESEPMVLSRLTSSDSSHEPSSPSSLAEGRRCCCCCWWWMCEEESASPSPGKLWFSVEALQELLLSASSSSSWATGWRGCGLKDRSRERVSEDVSLAWRVLHEWWQVCLT